jgi:hypothetical protein
MLFNITLLALLSYGNVLPKEKMAFAGDPVVASNMSLFEMVLFSLPVPVDGSEVPNTIEPLEELLLALLILQYFMVLPLASLRS